MIFQLGHAGQHQMRIFLFIGWLFRRFNRLRTTRYLLYYTTYLYSKLGQWLVVNFHELHYNVVIESDLKKNLQYNTLHNFCSFDQRKPHLPYFWNEKTKIARKKSIYFFKSDSSIPWTLETSISLPIGSCLARATTFFPPSISRLP